MIRIFIVDDSEIARTSLKKLLRHRADWHVVGEACNGHHALETFHLHMPHLTLMDFLMPKMNGLEAARHLIKRHPEVLILMITTDPSTQLEWLARSAGIKGICSKDKIDCLFNAVEAIIGGKTYFSEDAFAA
jgi:DNA-binding NarL/FixJ family response regulator